MALERGRASECTEGHHITNSIIVIATTAAAASPDFPEVGNGRARAPARRARRPRRGRPSLSPAALSAHLCSRPAGGRASERRASPTAATASVRRPLNQCLSDSRSERARERLSVCCAIQLRIQLCVRGASLHARYCPI